MPDAVSGAVIPQVPYRTDAKGVLLRISVIRYRGAAPAQPIAFDFDRQGGSIGRDAANELPLPDPERHVSRVQARVDFDGQGYGLFDLGRNPTLVDGRALIKGDRLSLAGGEILTMGSYELRVELPAPARSGAAARVTATAMQASDDPFAVFARLMIRCQRATALRLQHRPRMVSAAPVA